ncbi:histidine kinase [Desulfuromonas versatilis]|uniref:histidine kinase n=1 Tax=Desulfuromonas versatilis TaxID=2802975 RepID=A0ABN6E233_9BACT|nr:ATP-binding protein [Desulfuromonas versatilis]BCR06415.1 histidine kinase [Desulfuromonas versatilis]
MDPSCCWNKEQIAVEECPYIQGWDQQLLLNRKRRFLLRCIECPRFLEDLRAMNGQLDGLAGLFPYAIEELLALKMELQSLRSLNETRSREIKFLHEVSLVLQTSVDMDEVIAMALTAVTAGQGFGLNRAILLLVDKERQNLKGYFAVGPRRREEAGRIWQEIAERDLTLRELARHFFEEKMAAERERFRDLLELLSVPLSDNGHLFVRTLNELTSRHITDLLREPHLTREQAEALGVRELILVPLISKNRRIGLLLADNIINGRPISGEDLQSLETFALPVSFAIERASLYERLQEELERLTDANRRLQEQQEQILRMEKMALVGKIASNIAHSIRNPLTIIGGFARSLIKTTPEDDQKRRYIESIVRETRRLEAVLQEVLSYSESLHPTLDLWDVNQLVTGVYAGMQEDFKLARVTFQLDLEPNLPLVHIDYKQMAYCLRSILNNALEAMPGGGLLEIATRRVDDQLHLTLKDSGSGMSAETLRSITAPFFSTKDQGSGLGLSLCARILEGHGAELGVESREGAGTTFTIRLKITQGGTT